MVDLIGPGGGCIVAWSLLGFCGYIRRVIVIPPGGITVPPEPEPQPDWAGWLIGLVVGVGAGLIGGWALHELFAIEHTDSAGILITMVGAFAAGRIASDISSRLVPRTPGGIEAIGPKQDDPRTPGGIEAIGPKQDDPRTPGGFAVYRYALVALAIVVVIAVILWIQM